MPSLHFGAPPFVNEQEHAKLACYAALEQHAQLQKLQGMLADIIGIRKGLPQLAVRIGLDSGELVVGSVGTKQTKSFTVIGKTVEIAEQLEGANKRYGTNILITERTRQLAGETIETRKIDYLKMGEQGESMAVYELLGYGGAIDSEIKILPDYL